MSTIEDSLDDSLLSLENLDQRLGEFEGVERHGYVKAVDAMLTIGVGQRVGIFAAAGGGKSTLLSMIARNVDADSVVLALIGERGREVLGFLQDDLGEEGLKKSTVVVSTAEQPSLLRLKAAYTATAIAEEARRRGERVVL